MIARAAPLLVALVMAPLTSVAALAQDTGTSGPEAAAATTAPQPSTAPTTPVDQPEGIADIVVTAQKRSQNLQDVPLSISAFNEKALQQHNIQDLTAIGAIESGTQITNNSARVEVTIRGIGAASVISAFEQPVAVHIDGFYLARASAAVGGFYDIDRVEVLKGPQGTLYGRNATGGAINIITKKPTKEFSLEGRAEAIYIDDNGTGNGWGYIAGGTLNLPVSERIQTRLSVLRTHRDGYTTIIGPTGSKQEGQNAKNIAARGQINFDMSDRVSWLVQGDYFHANDRSGYIQVFGPSRADIPLTGSVLGGNNCGKCRITYSDIPTRLRLTNWGVTSTLTADLSDNVVAKSLTQYRSVKYFNRTDFDGTELPLGSITVPQLSKEFTQEVQLNADFNRLNLVLGAFYFRERINIKTTAPFPILPDDPALAALGIGIERPGAQGVGLGGKVKTDAWAIFGEGTYDLTDTLSFTTGGRYSHEKKGGSQNIVNVLPSFGPAFVGSSIGPLDSKTFTSFTPKIGINFKPSPDLLAYASYSRGFKSGGYNIANQSTDPTRLADSFNPEKITAYEIGLKASGLNRHIQVNVAGFHYNYTQLQLETIIGNGVSIQNSGKAHIYGADASLTVLPTDDWRLSLSGVLMRARYARSRTLLSDPIFPELGPQDIAGNNLPRAPEQSATISTDYTLRFGNGATLVPSFTAAYKSRQFFSPFNQPGIDQKGYWRLNAVVTYTSPDNHYSVSVYGDNLTNKLVYNGLFPGSALFGYQLQGITASPRVMGVRLNVRM